MLVVFCAAVAAFSSCKKKSTSNNVTVTSQVPDSAGDGVTYINSGTSAIFNLLAPGKTSVSVIGEFNNWTPTPMKNTTDGTRWYVQIDNLDPTKEYAYQYVINNTLKVADPYTHKILDPVYDPSIPASVYPGLKAYPAGATGIVSVMQGTPTPYTWNISAFTRPTGRNLVIYELLVRDFVTSHSYVELTDSLSYLAGMGITAIELMPVNEFEGNDSWGYNPNFLFALDKYYGTPNAYKAFIDACHAKGIAVIQDIVLEDQFASSPLVQMYWDSTAGQPSASNPWLDPVVMHPNASGFQMNHESTYTQQYTENVMKYWMQEYHIDGFRFDEGDGYTQTNSGSDIGAYEAYDASRVAIWTKYISYIKSLDPTFLITGEYWTVPQEQTVVSNMGYIVWNNLSTNAEQATMSYNNSGGSWDLSQLLFNLHGITQPYGMINYFESHDQERLQYDNEQYGNSSGSYNVKTLATGLQRNAMAAAFMFSVPGPNLIWQFGELGYDISINQNGRTGDKPILWNYLTVADRMALYNSYAQLIKWKLNNDVFTSASTITCDLADAIKTLQLKGTDNSVQLVGNFDVVTNTASVSFPSTGTWYDNITGTSITVSTNPYSITLAPGEYHLYSLTALAQ